MSILYEVYEAMGTRLEGEGFAWEFGRGPLSKDPTELGASPFICLDYDRTKPAAYAPSRTSHKRNPRVHWEIAEPCVAYLNARSTRDGATEDDHMDEFHLMEAAFTSVLYEVCQAKGLLIEGLQRQLEGDDVAEYRNLFGRLTFTVRSGSAWEPRKSSNGDSLVAVTTTARAGSRVDTVCSPTEDT